VTSRRFHGSRVPKFPGSWFSGSWFRFSGSATTYEPRNQEPGNPGTREPGNLSIATLLVLCASVLLEAHNGPPFPIVSDQTSGAYVISIWTDPDTTDDGTPGGQFWVRLARVGGRSDIPKETRTTVAIRAHGRPEPENVATATPVRGDVTNQFAALVMNHEGRFDVRVSIDGPLGAATVNAEVNATYDLRPPRYMLIVYLLPFVMVGVLWGRMLLRRRTAARQDTGT
jgi:hypothetical protein